MRTILLILISVLISLPSIAQKKASLKKSALKMVDEMESNINTTCTELWNYSETALLETKSADHLVSILKKEGFNVDEGVAGMPTAFVATYGSGSPVLGILAEYDALPGVGNEPVPYRQDRKDGITSGQGCGHNLFGSACVYAAVTLKRMIEDGSLKGTIKLYGTPAEETVVGKVYMARDGIFDDADIVLEWHPGLDTGVGTRPGLAMNNFTVEFFGQAAHGAADPWNGRSALDAVEMMNYGVNLMREHIEPTARIHYVIPNGGEAPNVVPEYAKVWYYVRDVNRENVEKYYERILKIAEGAAIATRTTHKIYLITGVHEYNMNRPLQEALQANLEMVGAPQFSEEEQEWGRQLQKSVEKEEKGFSTRIRPLDEKKKGGSGSTDVAEVSFITPTAGFSVATAPEGVPWHSWATSSSHGTSAGMKGAVIATKVLALTGIDVFTDAELVKRAKADFQEKTGGKPYNSPLPEGQKVLLPGN